MPGGCKRTGLGLAVSDCHGNDEVRIIERCPVGVRDGISKFPTFMNRTWGLRCAVRTDPSGEGKLLEELEHARFVSALVRINFGVVPFQIAVGEGGRRAMAGARDIQDI